MIIRIVFFLWAFLLFAFQCPSMTSLKEDIKNTGYLEIYNKKPSAATFDSLYTHFDTFIEFLQANPAWAQKLYSAKERFIRSKDRNIYSTDFFGFYDESKRGGRGQISFYYSPHFHEFICTHYPEFKQLPPIINFLKACCKIQKPYGDLCNEAAKALTLETIFSSEYGLLLFFSKYQIFTLLYSNKASLRRNGLFSFTG